MTTEESEGHDMQLAVLQIYHRPHCGRPGRWADVIVLKTDRERSAANNQVLVDPKYSRIVIRKG